MDERLREIATRQGQVFSRGQALGLGYSDRHLVRATKDQVLYRVRRGVYAEKLVWDSLSPVDRHRAAVHAAVLRCSSRVVVSHLSAAVLHGWPVWGQRLDEVWVTHGAEHGQRIEAGVRHHRASLSASEVVWIDGIPVTSAERTMVDLARHLSFESAVVSLDAAIRSGADRALAQQMLQASEIWPLARRAGDPLVFADGLAESPLESRTRVLCYVQGLPVPTPQVVIFDADGEPLGRVDLVIKTPGVGIECDGEVKYAATPGEPVPRSVLFEEKRREDRLREAGFEIVRVVHEDLNRPRATAARIWAAIARAESRRAG